MQQLWLHAELLTLLIRVDIKKGQRRIAAPFCFRGLCCHDLSRPTRSNRHFRARLKLKVIATLYVDRSCASTRAHCGTDCCALSTTSNRANDGPYGRASRTTLYGTRCLVTVSH